MTPEGYMKDAQGNLVPEAKVKPEHKLEDEVARRLTASAQSINKIMAEFRSVALGEVGALRDLIAEKYGAVKGGPKGNVTLRSYDGTVEVQVQVGDNLAFGPELQAAKSLIDACVERWSEGANDNIRALVNHAFQVNKAGRIDTQRVLGLRRLDISDPDWKGAMEAIADAVRVVSSKTYLRFYSVNPDTGAKTPIPLDLAAV